MPEDSATCGLPTLRTKDILTRVVMQERENANLQDDVRLWEEKARRAAAEERTTFAEVDRSLQEVVRLCMRCASSAHDESLLDAVAQELMAHAQEEDAAARSFALEERNTRVKFLRLYCAPGGGRGVLEEDVEQQRLLECAAEEEAARERREIMQLEQERLELEKRTESATLQYACELFNVQRE